MIATQAEGRVYGCKPVLRTRDAGTACRPKPVRRVLVCQADRQTALVPLGRARARLPARQKKTLARSPPAPRSRSLQLPGMNAKESDHWKGLDHIGMRSNSKNWNETCSVDGLRHLNHVASVDHCPVCCLILIAQSCSEMRISGRRLRRQRVGPRSSAELERQRVWLKRRLQT
jgi:hypothetical protein